MRAPIDDFKLELFPKGNVTQFFGENKDLYSPMGLDGHNGIDIVAPWGTPIYAVTDQKVVHTKEGVTGYGKYVKCIDDKFEYTYGHLAGIACKQGAEIKEGDLIGLMGNTGFVVSGSTPFWKYNPYAGTHLHFGMRKLGGRKWETTYPSGDTVNIRAYDNGFKGSIDPQPTLKIIEIEDVLVTLEKHKLSSTSLSIKGAFNEVISMFKKIKAVLAKK